MGLSLICSSMTVILVISKCVSLASSYVSVTVSPGFANSLSTVRAMVMTGSTARAMVTGTSTLNGSP